ncbi:MAG: FtsX-like permease family protein [Herbinix sp.]|nr:FtsX-like permease family protein [Herbinix sp.]
MKLLRTYSKLMIVRNYLNYLFVVLSIVVTYILSAITMVYMDNILILSTESLYSNLHYIYISVRTIFFIAGITFVISQYYNIMKSSMRDYYILRGLGATKNTIRILIILQIIFLMVVSIPIGLLGGYILTGYIINFLGKFSLNHNTLEWIASSTTFFLLAGATCCLIISIGVYLEIGVRKMPLSNILSDYPIIGKEG